MITRDQKRALLAYEQVDALANDKQRFDNFATLVNNLGAQIIRSGLAAALAFAERYRDQDAVTHLLSAIAAHLGKLNVPGIQQPNDRNIAGQIRALSVADYMLVTRELLKLIIWLKRAIQAHKAQRGTDEQD